MLQVLTTQDWWRDTARRRLHVSLGVSMLLHGLRLGLVVDGDVTGLPGLILPWQERRCGEPDLPGVVLPAASLHMACHSRSRVRISS